MTTISEEEENYVRMSLLLSGISSRAVRSLFDSEFSPSCLNASIKKQYNIIHDLQVRKIINQSQWNLLFPRNGKADSRSFDVTLMTTLLMNLTKLNYYTKLPFETDVSKSADLARIKHYRNCISHISDNKDGKIDSACLNKAWDDISGAVGRLGGQDMLDECTELKIKCLNRSTVPWNIRVQMNHILEEWKMNAVDFVETRASKHVMKKIQENSCVIITGSSGVGKTATLRHVALKMADEGYDILLPTCPNDIVTFYNPDKKTLFVIDNMCGNLSLDHCDFISWETVRERINVVIQNKLTKIIVACRYQVYQDERFESLSIFRTCVCNLLSEDLCLSPIEKQLIAELYLEKDAAAIIQYCDLYDCFPLLCALYHDNPQQDITDLFRNPSSVYEAEIHKLHRKKYYGKYCALALCVMFNNNLIEKWLIDEIDTNKKAIIENTFEACRLDRSTSRLIMLDELKALEGTFIKKEQNAYKSLHDKIFDFMVSYFGRNLIHCLIMNADSYIIMERFLLEKKYDMDRFITVVPSNYHQMYIQRMINDWSAGKVRIMFKNINMKVPEFRVRFLCYLKRLDMSFQKQLAKTCDVVFKDTVLLGCSFYGDIMMIQWCFNHGIDVNQCNKNDVGPLFVAAQEGHTEAVKLLTNNNTDINKCSDTGASPLFIACQRNHIEIVNALLHNKADINQCTVNGTSPLHISCQNNHLEIANILLNNKADICSGKDNEGSLMINACENNNIEIVNLLLHNKASVNKCGKDGASPLFIACYNNNIELLKVLLHNNADIDKCVNDGLSPLYIASQNNHIAIVDMLLKKNADIDKCTSNGLSPLFVACMMNHIEIVKCLVGKTADIDKCQNDGASPLFIACTKNHLEIVKILLSYKADCNKCEKNEMSPLFIACQQNHIEIVKVLLDNKADINKCKDDGVSPLHVACQQNHIEIVKSLLSKKADINCCTYAGASPLCIACYKNHIEIAKVLLDNKADINKWENTGASPLYFACQQNNIEIVKILLENNADLF
ncbi:ankyrin-3-like [Mytilus californianus]|uniref:ankyrin-3-like n=1 Tax=Mytilus californianus TaxID=6549 RepID=UPI0022470CDE|nr:ankyrin-3-like [Mytilus californianus]XP_052087467.1 ankyrin-3-like [Mytilus californianus]XP_052087468.1 ankyrin-3-like [Mytilus californianus]